MNNRLTPFRYGQTGNLKRDQEKVYRMLFMVYREWE